MLKETSSVPYLAGERAKIVRETITEKGLYLKFLDFWCDIPQPPKDASSIVVCTRWFLSFHSLNKYLLSAHIPDSFLGKAYRK